MVCRIKRIDSTLVATHARHVDNLLIPSSPARFVGEQKWLRQIKFESDKKGMITGFWAGSAYARDIWFKMIS